VAEARQPSLNVLRGLAGAVAGAAAAVALVAVLSAAFLACRWAVTEASAFDRDFDIRDARERLPLPAIGCAVVAGCAGWSALAPARRSPFAWTLVVVFAGSAMLWTVVGSLELTPRRYKSVSHPFLYPSEALFLVGPPVVVAGLLTARRVRRGGAQTPSQEL
jgi:hypothetical protein